MDSTPGANKFEEIKQKGNDCVKEGKYEEAVLHYTHAIKLDLNNYTLYSNRSLAFLKLDQHYLALQDANETIKLQPSWAKGYYRRAEVEAASDLYDEAILSYGHALQLQPQDTLLIDAIKKITQTKKDRIKGNENIIWISTCIGLILGLSLVIFDYTLTEKPTLTNPIIMVAFALAIAGSGWGVGKVLTLIRQWNAGKSLLPPENLVNTEEDDVKSAGGSEKRSTKYTKAQARQRYKQGKL